jgi:hypothetical protein
VISTNITTKGKGKASASKAIPNLAKSERGENITSIECVAVDGWHIDPWFIFKGMFPPILLNHLIPSDYSCFLKATGSSWKPGLIRARPYHWIL